MRSIVLAAAGLLLFATLTACNDATELRAVPQPSATPSGGVVGLTPENATQVASNVVSTIEGFIVGSAASSPTAAAASAASASTSRAATSADDCMTINGDTSDDDGDGIFLDAKFAYDACSDSFEGWTETFTGIEELSDTAPTVADGAFLDSYDVADRYVKGDDFENDHYTGHLDGIPGADVSEFTYGDHMRVEYAGSEAGAAYTGLFEDDLLYDYRFDDAGSLWLVISGGWHDREDGGNDVSLELSTSAPLLLDFDCPSQIVAGTVVATSGTATETITWTACGAFSTELSTAL